MNTWLRRLRGALGMGFIWAVGWAIVRGGIMEALVDPNGVMLDMSPQALGMAGFMGGVAFSVVLGIAGSRRKFEELSLLSFALWGTVAGAVLGIAVGVNVMIIATLVLLCAASASSSLVLARKAEKRNLIDAGS